MNNGAFGENFPYSNFHDLNMDWIIKIAKDFLDQYTNIQELISSGEQSITDLTEESLQSLNNKAQELETALQDWYNTHRNFLDQYLADAIQEFNTSAEQKAKQTIASIPDDYTELANKVMFILDAISKLYIIELNAEDTAGFENNKFIATNGTIITINGWALSGYIDLTNPATIVYTATSGNDPILLQYYDSQHNVIASHNRDQITVTAGEGHISLPQVGAYVRVNYPTANMSVSIMNRTIPEAISDLNNDIKITNAKPLLNSSAFTQGWFDVNGSMQTTADPDLFNAWSAYKEFICTGTIKTMYITNNMDTNLRVFIYKYTDKTTPLSGSGEITILPHDLLNVDISNCAYIHLSTPSGLVENLDFDVMIENDNYLATVDDSFVDTDHLRDDFGTGLATVSINGGGDYTDIGQAYNATGRNGVLYIKSGKYISTSQLSLDTAFLVGENAETVFIENTNTRYPNDALRVRAGVIDNITIYATAPDNADASYAVHIDEDSYRGKNLLFKNCTFVSTYNASVGIGMRKNQVLCFENCHFLSLAQEAAFFHDWVSANEQNNEYIIFKNCTFESIASHALKIESINPLNNLVATFINCNFFSNAYGAMNPINFNTPTTHGYLCGNSVKLGQRSCGNNAPQLNAK